MCSKHQKVYNDVALCALTVNCPGLVGPLFVAEDGMKENAESGDLMVENLMKSTIYVGKVCGKVESNEERDGNFL